VGGSSGGLQTAIKPGRPCMCSAVPHLTTDCSNLCRQALSQPNIWGGRLEEIVDRKEGSGDVSAFKLVKDSFSCILEHIWAIF